MIFFVQDLQPHRAPGLSQSVDHLPLSARALSHSPHNLRSSDRLRILRHRATLCSDVAWAVYESHESRLFHDPLCRRLADRIKCAALCIRPAATQAHRQLRNGCRVSTSGNTRGAAGDLQMHACWTRALEARGSLRCPSGSVAESRSESGHTVGGRGLVAITPSDFSGKRPGAPWGSPHSAWAQRLSGRP